MVAEARAIRVSISLVMSSTLKLLNQEEAFLLFFLKMI
jgi:hypothetical protein